MLLLGGGTERKRERKSGERENQRSRQEKDGIKKEKKMARSKTSDCWLRKRGKRKTAKKLNEKSQLLGYRIRFTEIRSIV